MGSEMCIRDRAYNNPKVPHLSFRAWEPSEVGDVVMSNTFIPEPHAAFFRGSPDKAVTMLIAASKRRREGIPWSDDDGEPNWRLATPPAIHQTPNPTRGQVGGTVLRTLLRAPLARALQKAPWRISDRWGKFQLRIIGAVKAPLSAEEQTPVGSDGTAASMEEGEDAAQAGNMSMEALDGLLVSEGQQDTASESSTATLTNALPLINLSDEEEVDTEAQKAGKDNPEV